MLSRALLDAGVQGPIAAHVLHQMNVIPKEKGEMQDVCLCAHNTKEIHREREGRIVLQEPRSQPMKGNLSSNSLTPISVYDL